MKIHWWEDSASRHTCHTNGQKMNFQESYLGEVKSRDGGFYYKLSDGTEWVGPYTYMYHARRALEEAVGGTQVNDND